MKHSQLLITHLLQCQANLLSAGSAKFLCGLNTSSPVKCPTVLVIFTEGEFHSQHTQTTPNTSLIHSTPADRSFDLRADGFKDLHSMKRNTKFRQKKKRNILHSNPLTFLWSVNVCLVQILHSQRVQNSNVSGFSFSFRVRVLLQSEFKLSLWRL